MNVIKSRFVYHLMAIITVAIWGTTFVSTKILIQHGLSPSDIFFYRFTLAYLCMWCISYKKLFANRVKDELLLLLAGLCGGTIYFITENTALGITLASNVSLIVCTSPVLTTLLSYLFRRKEPFTRHLVYGSIMALIGVGLVVFNGSFILKINPLGDILSLTAALMWAFYYACCWARASARRPASPATWCRGPWAWSSAWCCSCCSSAARLWTS